MSEIDELERRIAAALDRIGGGVEALELPAPAVPEPAPEPEPAAPSPEIEAELARLREALEAEREANAQLEERVRELRRRQEAEANALHAEIEEKRLQLKAVVQRQEELDAQNQHVRRTNHQLRQSIQALREAATDNVTDPSLINGAIRAELDGLSAARAAERAEVDAILRDLKPLLQEGAHA